MNESKSEKELGKRWRVLDSFEVFGKAGKKEVQAFGIEKALGVGSVENNISQFLSRGPAKNIFFTFVSNFLQKKKEKAKSIFKKPSRVKINANSNIDSQESTPAVVDALLKRNAKGVSTKNLSTKSVMFPSLRPSNSLHTFLQREKNRLEASQTERLLLIKQSLNDGKKNIKTSKVKQAREKESKKSKKPGKRNLSALIIKSKTFKPK